MDCNKLVSVVIPTYNVEKYLDKSLKSIVSQTYNNLEIIIVIDGATDNSYEIAKMWAKRDKRIKIIYQENLGSGPARNNGIKNSKGEFIMFVDPDDWIDENMVEELLIEQSKENVELVLSNFRIVNPNSKIIIIEKNIEECTLLTKEEVRNNYMKLFGAQILDAPTRKLYKRSIIEENNILFPDLRRSQDIVFNYRYYDKISSLKVVNKAYYNYMIDKKNYISKLKKDYYKVIELIYNEIMEMNRNWGLSIKEYYSEFCGYWLYSIIANLESNVITKNDISPIIESETIQEIVKNSNPKRLDQRAFKKVILSKNKKNITILVKLKIFLKNVKVKIDELKK